MKYYSENIAVIGAGKISYSLISALKKKKFHIEIIVSKHLGSAKKLAHKFNIKKYSNRIEDISPKCDLYFLAVPDNQIKIVAESLSHLKLNFKNSLFVHLSGALDISLLSDLKNKKAKAASFHIMQTFPTKRIINIKDSYVAVETDNENVRQILFKIAKSLQLKPFELKTEKKAYYHAAIAIFLLMAMLLRAMNFFAQIVVHD